MFCRGRWTRHRSQGLLRTRSLWLTCVAIVALLVTPQGSEPGDPTSATPAGRAAITPGAASDATPGTAPGPAGGGAARGDRIFPPAIYVARDGVVEVVLAADAVWDPKVAPHVHLQGSQSGLQRATPRFDPETRTLSLTPARSFLPGEVLRLAIARTETFPGVLRTFRVMAGRAPAQFARASRLAVGTSPSTLAAADVDADGDPDLVASDVQGEDGIHVFMNDGEFNFTPLATASSPGIEDPSRFALADLDRDGRLDLVIPGETSNTLVVLRGRGDGRFAASPIRTLESASPVHAVTGDLDLDGHDEILIAHLRGADRIAIVAGDANGNFGRERRVRTGRGIGSLALADLDGDQDLDLVAANEDSDQLLVLHNQGEGRFELTATLRTGDRPEAVLAGDLNGDSIPDFVTTNQGANDISVFLARTKPHARGEIEYADPVAYVTGDRPFIPALADLDGDGDLDLAVPGLLSDDVTVLMNQGQGRFTRGAHFTVDPGPVSVQAADFDGDGALDLAVASSIADNVTVYRNTPPIAPGPIGMSSAAGGAAHAKAHGSGEATRELAQNVPNPFNPATEIPFQLERPGHVLLVVFNSSGKVVRTLVDEYRSTGTHTAAWDGTTDAGDKAPSGTYFYRLTTEDTVELRRMTLLR